MPTPETDAQAPDYVYEYRQAYVPFTSEDEQGVITDVTSGRRVELPATHPEYRGRYGAQVIINHVNQEQ